MPPIGRIGDSISCGDFIASGSSSVFANGMPIAVSTDVTTGHGCFPSTSLAGPFASTVFVNGLPVVLQGITQIVSHVCDDVLHGGVVSSGAGSVSAEG